MSEWIRLLGGALLLFLGAQWLVGGASALALALRVRQLIVGLTVVAYGTSAPEVIVTLNAAAGAHGEVALGNIIGSSIANIGLVLGAAVLVRPIQVLGGLRRCELPVLLGSTALLPVVFWDGSVNRSEGGGLLLFAASYSIWMFGAARDVPSEAELRLDEPGAAIPLLASPRPTGLLRAAATASAGLVILILGGRFFVGGAVATAGQLGMSDRLVGLTIVAVGTSLPELVSSVVAAARGHSELVVGNVVGSNIFNTLLCLGGAGLTGSVWAPLAMFQVDLAILAIATVLAVVLVRGRPAALTLPRGRVSSQCRIRLRGGGASCGSHTSESRGHCRYRMRGHTPRTCFDLLELNASRSRRIPRALPAAAQDGGAHEECAQDWTPQQLRQNSHTHCRLLRPRGQGAD